MQNDIFIHSESNFNKQIPDLHNIFSQKQIVQAYNHKYDTQLIFTEPHRNTNKNFHSKDIFIQHQQVQVYNKKQKRFAEDDIYGQLHSGNIVENFQMIDQRDEPYDQIQNVFKGRGQKPIYLNQNMLASSSENNDVPSRNSSLSSLSEKNQIMNMGNHRQFLHDDFIEKGVTRNHVKSSLLANKQSIQNHFKANSQNEMDIENSPYDDYYDHHNNQSKNLNKHLYPRHHANVDMRRNNILMSPEKKIALPNFRRTDINEDQEKRERLQKIEKIQQAGCNCKKSRCLKMYCECFNLQIFCNENCNCTSCCNQESNEEHRKAVLDALTRNPKAFNEVTQKIDATFKLGVQLNQVKKGCKCKKTRCQKKYCECYNIGEKCGKFCKCQGCQNC